MVKEIRWSLRASQDRLEILDYWINRNKSKFYSLKLDLLFRESIELIAETPEIGKPTDSPDVRIKIVRDCYFGIPGEIQRSLNCRDLYNLTLINQILKAPFEFRI